MYCVRIREMGDVLAEFETYKEAFDEMKDYEAEDFARDKYECDYYEIVADNGKAFTDDDWDYLMQNMSAETKDCCDKNIWIVSQKAYLFFALQKDPSYTDVVIKRLGVEPYL